MKGKGKKHARVRFRGIGIAFGGSIGSSCLVAALLVSGCSGESPDDHLSKIGLLEELQRNPGVPFALPRTLPPGYRIISAEAVVKDLRKGGRVTIRQIHFQSDATAGGNSLVDVCIEEPEKPDQCGQPNSDASFTRELKDAHVVVNLYAAGPQDATSWRAADFTTEVSEVTWLK